ncbi:uncharacterized protein DFL_004456 [Arthrobotrys flagrans]|uniref:Uncharacterized protein n=1 Tax=Arthrobotrys flagrans TaxID=97331 RepID=A0A437A4W2_ARTFL|nr:hypothetical protein DFL_004456 [Arthrobotrys flagrans]
MITNGRAQLVHFSVQEFLTRPEADWPCENEDDRKMKSIFRVDIEAAHLSLEKSSLDGELYGCKLGAAFERELEHRRQEFGNDDPLTKRLQFLYDWAEELSLDGAGSGEPSATVPEIMNLIRNHEIVPRVAKLDLFLKLGIYLSKFKPLSDPLKLLFRAILEMAEKITVPVLCIIGFFYHSLGKLDQALEVYYLALTKEEGLNEIIKCGLFSAIEAEETYQCAIDRKERVFGHEDRITIRSVSCLGSVLLDQKKYSEAEEMFRRAMEERQKMFGGDNPDTFNSVRNVGISLNWQGKHFEAEAMLRCVMEGRQKVLGQEDPATLQSMNDVGNELCWLKKYSEAEEIFRRVIEGQENILGPENSDTPDSVNSLGNALYGQRNYSEAEEMYKRALEGRRKQFGIENPKTLRLLHNLGWAYSVKIDIRRRKKFTK